MEGVEENTLLVKEINFIYKDFLVSSLKTWKRDFMCLRSCLEIHLLIHHFFKRSQLIQKVFKMNRSMKQIFKHFDFCHNCVETNPSIITVRAIAVIDLD